MHQEAPILYGARDYHEYPSHFVDDEISVLWLSCIRNWQLGDRENFIFSLNCHCEGWSLWVLWGVGETEVWQMQRRPILLT